MHEKCRNVLSKSCINFGRCYGNQGWAEVVENKFLFCKLVKLSESFESVAQGVLEIFEEVYLGGGGTMCPLVGIGLNDQRAVHTSPAGHRLSNRSLQPVTSTNQHQTDAVLLTRQGSASWNLRTNCLRVHSKKMRPQ